MGNKSKIELDSDLMSGECNTKFFHVTTVAYKVKVTIHGNGDHEPVSLITQARPKGLQNLT